MKRSAILFLQLVLVLVGLGALALLLWEPRLEGRNAHATLRETYLHDPFLAFVYFGSLPFFGALFQACKLLGYAGQNQIFSPAAVHALRTIRYCAIALIGFVAVGEIALLLGNSDDRAGGVFMGLLITFPSIVIGISAALFERRLQNAAALKCGNNLVDGSGN